MSRGNSKERREREEGRKSARKELGWVEKRRKARKKFREERKQSEESVEGEIVAVGKTMRKRGLNDKRKAQEENSRDERSVGYKKGIPAIETKRAVS